MKKENAMKIKTLLSLGAAAIVAAATGCSTTTTALYRSVKTVDVKPSGLYVGAAAFGGDVKNITGGSPVLLNEEGFLFLVRAVSVRYQVESASGATLYGAMEKAAATVNASLEHLPDDVESVNFVVFTNRLHAGAPPTLKVAGKDVTVYAVGLRDGIADQPAFEAQLNAIAGGKPRAYGVDGFEAVEKAFSDIESKIALSRGGSTVVYFALDAAPSAGKAGVEAAKDGVMEMLSDLSARVDLSLPTPLTETYLNERDVKVKTEINWGETLIGWGVSVLCVALIVGVAALVVVAGE